MSEVDKELCELLARIVPNLKRRILRHVDREPDVFNLDVVLLASIVTIRKEICMETRKV